MAEQEKYENAKIQASEQSNAVGSISVGGDVSGNIHVGNVGYSSEDVSKLLLQISSTFQAKAFDGKCPYKGLDVFEEEDAELFFGRETLVEELVRRVKESRTVFITGPSGSGKSSLVRAGLLPSLKQGTVKGSEQWLYATMKPGRDPIRELGRVLASLAGTTNAEDEIRAKALNDESIFARWAEIVLKDGRDKRLALFIDQFEEVFTQISHEEERIAFLNLLTHAADVENGRVILLFSMRSDFVPNCAVYPELNATLNQQFIQIGAMQPEELVSAIAQPALRVGLRIDPDLIAQIINDMKGEPGALPLMQFALKDLFDSLQEKGGIHALTLNDYLQRGGIQKSLERHADAAFAHLSEHEKELTRSIFSGLIEVGRGTQDTRRTAIFDELIPSSANAEEVEIIVQKLADARLITTDESAGRDTVTISHEKLIDAWPWLKKLVNENRDVIALQNEIAEDAKEWEEHKRDSSYLYSGARLGNAREKMKEQKLVLSGLAQEFIKQGIIKQESERKAKELLRKRITIGLVSGIVIAIALAVYGFTQAKIAQTNANIALAGKLAAQVEIFREKDFQRSLLLSIEANRIIESNQITDNTQTRGTLFDFLNEYPNLVGTFSPNKPANIIKLSADGNFLALANDEDVILWDIVSETSRQMNIKNASNAVDLAISYSGKYVIATICKEFDPVPPNSCQSRTGLLWDTASNQTKSLPGTENTGSINSFQFSLDEQYIFLGYENGNVIQLDTESLQLVKVFSNNNSIVVEAVSPDNKFLALLSKDGVILWDIEEKEEKKIFTEIEGGSFTFSPDGKILIANSVDFLVRGGGGYLRSIKFIDTSTGKTIQEPIPDYGINTTFSDNGEFMATINKEGYLIIYNLWENLPSFKSTVWISLPNNNNFNEPIQLFSISSDGKIAAISDSFGNIMLINTSTELFSGASKILNPPPEITGQIFNFSFKPQGNKIISVINDGFIEWDIDADTAPTQTHINYDIAYVVSVSPDGSIFISKEKDDTYAIRKVSTGELINKLPFTPYAHYAISYDNTKVAIGYCISEMENNWTPCPKGEGKILFRSITLAKDIGKPILNIDNEYQNLTFNKQGTVLASSDGNNISLWDMSTYERIGMPFTGEISYIAGLAFSPDGQILASQSGTRDSSYGITLWDTNTRQPIGQPILYTNEPLVFSPDGKILAVAGDQNRSILLWNMDVPSLITEACAIVGRNLTRTEWALYMPKDIPYPANPEDSACPQWEIEKP